MKTWKWLVIVLVIALLVAYYVLGMDYLKQRRQNTDTNSQITELITTLSGIPPYPPDLEQKLADARAELAAAEKSFAGETDDTLIVNNVLQMAKEAGVKAIPLSTRPWAVESIYERNYNVFYLTLSVTGNLIRLQNFIERLENSEAETLVIKNLKVERTSVTSGDNALADITIAVYTLMPATE